jgi:hypothetical protein
VTVAKKEENFDDNKIDARTKTFFYRLKGRKRGEKLKGRNERGHRSAIIYNTDNRMYIDKSQKRRENQLLFKQHFFNENNKNF